MNFIETLSAFSGLKSSKPFIEPSFFPVVPEKYITISTENHQSKQWDHFQEYIDIIYPILNKNNISIVEIGQNKINLNNVIGLKGATGPNQWSYIIEKSLIHIGPENFLSQLASYHSRPFIAFFSNTTPEYSWPNWSNNDNQIAIQADLQGEKPSFSGDENPKTINRISAEEVASKTLSILNIPNDFDKFEVFSIGSLYSSNLVEIVPDFIPDNNFFNRSLINIRMDYHFNESLLPNFASNRKVSIVTDKEIDFKILMHIKPAIEHIFYKISEDSSEKYIKEIQSKAIPFSLIASKEHDISMIKYKFFDFEIIEEEKKSKKDIDNIEKLCDTTRYKSKKKIFSKDGEFSSKPSYDKKIKTHNDEIIIDEEEFWEDINHFKLYNLKGK